MNATSASFGVQARVFDSIFCSLICLLFSNISLYGSLVRGWTIPMSFWVAVLTALVILMLLRPQRTSVFGEPFPLWTFAYLALVSVWFVSFGGTNAESFGARWLFAIVGLACYSGFRTSRVALEATPRLLAWFVVLAAAVNAYDISHPFSLVPATFQFANPGRAAGFYVNANQAAAAIVLGSAVAAPRVSERWKSAFLAVSLLAVVLTASRSGLIGWVIVMASLCGLGGGLTASALFRSLLLTALMAVGAWLLVAEKLEESGLNLRQLTERAEWFTTAGQLQDTSQSDRERIAVIAWEEFSKAPLIGHGVGMTDSWIHGLATHNLHMTNFVEFGIWGMLIVPVLAAVIVSGINRSTIPVRIAGSAALLWFAIFDHGVLSEYPVLVCISWIAAGGRVLISDESAAYPKDLGEIRL